MCLKIVAERWSLKCLPESKWIRQGARDGSDFSAASDEAVTISHSIGAGAIDVRSNSGPF